MYNASSLEQVSENVQKMFILQIKFNFLLPQFPFFFPCCNLKATSL